MGNLEVLVLTPAGTGVPSLAIAACRAGARGFLDLEHAADSPTVPDALAQLARFAPDGFGVKLGPDGGALLPSLLADDTVGPASCRSYCREVILAGDEQPEWADWIARFHRRNIRVLWEAVTLAEARRGAEMDIDGLILKGHESGGRVGTDSTFLLLQRWHAAVAAGEVRKRPVYAQGGIGLHTAAACVAAGAAGVVLDNQLLLTREARLPEPARTRLLAFDGSETQGRMASGEWRVAGKDSPSFSPLATRHTPLSGAAAVAEQLDMQTRTIAEAVLLAYLDEPGGAAV